MKKHKIENNSIVSTVVLEKLSDSFLYSRDDGWVDEQIPQINRHFEYLGAPFYDESLDAVSYQVESSETPTLEQIKESHRKSLGDVMNEISDIVTLYKNINDPFSNTPENISSEFSNLMMQSLVLKSRAIQEINLLQTREDAVNYVIRGPEVIQYINTLKSFI